MLAGKIQFSDCGRVRWTACAEPSGRDPGFCLISTIAVAEIKRELEARGIDIIGGPVERTSAEGTLSSIYFRDP
jgi:hypothetical protein